MIQSLLWDDLSKTPDADSGLDEWGEPHGFKVCTRCGALKPLSAFHKKLMYRKGRAGSCRDCENEHDRVVSAFKSSGSYFRMLEAQGGVCAICGREGTRNSNGVPGLSVDCDPSTLEVRGLLCMHCNTTLGKVGENVAILLRMVAYLTRGAIRGLNASQTSGILEGADAATADV